MKYSLLALVVLLTLSSHPAMANCAAIQDHDRRAFCMAKTTEKSVHCGRIKDNDDRRMCFALVDKNKGHCAAIKDRDKRNECRASF